MEIVRANESHIQEISRLFDLYRQFYRCEPNIDLATQFISDRFNNGESVIFVAQAKDTTRVFPCLAVFRKGAKRKRCVS